MTTGRTSDALVVGGGVVGCAVAYFLARERVAVTLIERDEIALHASGAAAGMLRPMGENRPSEAFFRWGMRSLAMFPELVAELCERSGVDAEFVASGALDIAVSEESAGVLREKARRLAEHGVEWLDAADARAAEPQLTEELVGALWSPREAHVRSPLLARAFAAAAVQLGARIETGVLATGLRLSGTRVTGLETSAGTRSAPHVILCMGAWSPACRCSPTQGRTTPPSPST